MKKALCIFFTVLSLYAFSQLSADVVNSNTGEEIPYVNIWVENEDIGTTSDDNGKFEIDIPEPKWLIFTATGYESKKVWSESISSVVELIPVVQQLDEVLVTPRKHSLFQGIGAFNKLGINCYFACRKPWMIARFFPFEETMTKTPYLDKVKILTQSNIKNAKFNLRLYLPDESGAPGDYLYYDNIIVTPEKGKKITEIDV